MRNAPASTVTPTNARTRGTRSSSSTNSTDDGCRPPHDASTLGCWPAMYPAGTMNVSPSGHPRRPRRWLGRLGLIALVAALVGCSSSIATGTPGVPSPVPSGSPSPASSGRPWLDATRSVEDRVAALLGQMTLDEKIGQMTQIEKNSIDPANTAAFYLGSVLSGGDGSPDPNTAQAWHDM